MNENKSVTVIGAGVVGLSCALWLQKKDFKVTLVDPEIAGSGTSSGNACTIADYACIPVNSPSIFTRLPSLLFSKNSPLTVDPLYALRNLPWLIRFLVCCTPNRVAHSVQELAHLLDKTHEGLNPLLDLTESNDLIAQQGCMYVYKSLREFNAAKADNQIRRDHGVEFNELDSNEIRELEPGLKMTFEKGLLFGKASQVINPQSLSTQFFKSFIANGGLHLIQKVVAVTDKNSSIEVQLSNGDKFKTDQVVVAAGAFSRDIKGCGAEHLPLDTERGYHVQYSGLQSLLKRPVSWNEAGFYATPMNEGLRIVGTVELAGYKPEKNPNSLRYLQRKAEQMFDLPRAPDQQWLGFRPTLPDALPAIGYSPVSKRILFAFGHHHLGLTLSGITGKLISELANRETPSQSIAAFDPSRF